MLAVGLMSGTSLDGVDVSLVEINPFKNSFKQVHYTFYPYEKIFKEKLLSICLNKPTNIQTICSLNVELSLYYIKAIEKLLKETELEENKIKFIAMHGQTVWHNPHRLGGYESSTLQLGDASRIASRFNTKVVSNFRPMDMSFGGEGAPLVPFANWCLYSNKEENIALQNIGGIGNVTFLKKGGKPKDIIAFDTGPGNILIDQAMRKLFNKDFDNHGEIAKSGRIINQALDILFKDPFLKAPLPKSTGREAYNEEFLDEVIKLCHECGGSDADVITTLSAYTADTITESYKTYLGEINRVIVSGGGAMNDYIVSKIKNNLRCPVEIIDNADGLEALSFVILAYQTLNKKASNVPSVTGASKEVVLGEITDPRVKKLF